LNPRRVINLILWGGITQSNLALVSHREAVLSNEWVATTTLSYDGDGNLTSAGSSTFSWDYKNRLTQAVTQGSTTTYAYDDGLNRVSQAVGNTTTI